MSSFNKSYQCHWCQKTVTVGNQYLPKGWIIADQTEAPGNYYCNNAHYYEAKCLWEEAYDVGLEAASNYFEEKRRKRNQTFQISEKFHKRLLYTLLASKTACPGGVEEIDEIIDELNQLEPISDSLS